MRVNPTNSSPIQNGETTSANKSEKSKASNYENRAEGTSTSKKTDSVNAEISTRAREMAKTKQAATSRSDMRITFSYKCLLPSSGGIAAHRGVISIPNSAAALIDSYGSGIVME